MVYEYKPQVASELDPQDWKGYEGVPPDAKWPGGAKVCVSFVVHAEAGAELHETNGDAEAEMWLMETVIGSRAQIGHRGNMSSTTVYEYESARGFWNVLDVFDRYALPATLFVCGRSAELFPTFVQEAEKRKWEIVSENYRFIDYFGIDPAVEAEHTVKALECIKGASLSGTIPKSFHCPRPSHLTEGFALEAFKKSGAEMLYSNDGYGDDLPYYAPKTGLLYVPMSLDCNDQKFVSAPGFSSGVDFYDHVSSAFDCLYKEGSEGSPKMMTIAVHPRIISRPGRLAYFVKVIEHIKKHDGVWIPTREEIATHWKKLYPFKPSA